MTRQTLALFVAFALVVWAGSAGISYAVVELTGGGPQGEQGPQGARGERGPQGQRGESVTAPPSGSGLSNFDLWNDILRLSNMWAVDQIAQQRPGESITGDHPAVESCLDYIMNGEGSFVECGFQRADNP